MDQSSFAAAVPAVLAFGSVFLLTVALGQLVANWRVRRFVTRKVRRFGSVRRLRVLARSRRGGW